MQKLRRTTNKPLALLVTLLLACGLHACQEPIPTHQLQALPEHRLCATDTLFFIAPLSDSTQTYQISFTARTDRSLPASLWSLEITAEAPSGPSYREVIQLPCDVDRVTDYLSQCRENNEAPTLRLESGPAGNDWTWQYRRNIQPNENGTWKIALRLLEPTPLEGIHCFGIICTPENHEQ